jgi:drug/metabolite transporter (DMT)-like permease
MSPLAITLWLLNVVLDTTGQVALKVAASDPRFTADLAGWRALAGHPMAWTGVACYLVEFMCWLAFLTLVPLSLAVLLASLNIVSVMLASRMILGESVGPLRTCAVLLIAGGVAIVGWSAA